MRVEGQVNVCCHYVTFRYWWEGDPELTEELKEQMTEAAEERAQHCIIEGCHSGDLNYCDGEREIRGQVVEPPSKNT